MLYATPPLTPDLRRELKQLDDLRAQLGHELTQPSPWLGTLRRQFKAASVESSVSIEGFTVPEGAADEIVSEVEPADPSDENELAVACYTRAMDHVGVMATDPAFTWHDRVILDLHFDACYFQRDQSPGHWRTTPIFVTANGGVAYQGPDAADVSELMGETIEWLRSGDLDAHVVVRAAMAHLHVVSIHPFRDGNGRIARIAQSLVLAREGLLSPEVVSIEEYLGSHTSDYYRVLGDVQRGRYLPERDATPWVRFCSQAHIVQAQQRLDQIERAAARWSSLESLVEARGWPDRFVIALEQGLVGGTDRSKYEHEADVSPATASADLRRLVDAGLLVQTGRGRNIRYNASEHLVAQVS
jgi:Fic family protein